MGLIDNIVLLFYIYVFGDLEDDSKEYYLWEGEFRVSFN